MNLTSWRFPSAAPYSWRKSSARLEVTHSQCLVESGLEARCLRTQSLCWTCVVQPGTRQMEAGSRDRAGRGRPDTSTLCISMAMRMFGISYLRLNSVKKTLWTSALRGHKLSSWGQLMMDTFSRLNSQRHARGKRLNFKISNPVKAILSFQKHRKLAQEDKCVTFAHT